MRDLLSELRRRNVFKVVIVYVIAGWLIMQIVDVMFPALRLPDWAITLVAALIIIGFPFAIIFAWAYEVTPGGLKLEKHVDRSESITHETGRKLDFVIIGLLVVAVGYLTLDKFMFSVERDAALVEATKQAMAEQATPVPEETAPSIAVLPFVNISEDPNNEYFSDGISEEILNSLASIGPLKVAGRTSSFAFKDKDEDLRKIGKALGVEHILEGSVRKSGTKVRITAQLIQVEDGFHLWSETYDRELTDVFEIQDEIANAILEQLKARLLEGERVELASTRTDPVVYDRYLLARQRIYERNRPSIEAAVELLESAVAQDAQYAPAHAQLGIAKLLLREDQYGVLPREQSDELGKQHLDAALELAPDLAEAWAGLGLYHTSRPREHAQAIDALERALELNPNLIDASNWLQAAYVNAGRHARALPILENLLERDPLYRPAISNLVGTYNTLGLQQKSLALLERVRPFIPNDPLLLHAQAQTYFSLGEYAKGLPLAEEAVRQRPDDANFQVILGWGLWGTHQYQRMTELVVPFQKIYALHKLGRREEAMMLAYEDAAQGFIGPLFGLLNSMGRHEELIRFFEARWPDLGAFQTDFPHGADGYWLMTELAFAFLRTGDDERFRDAMGRVRAAHDQLLEEGIEDAALFMQEAVYFVMAEDHKAALDNLDRSVEAGFIADLRIAESFPQLEPLEGDPRFEAIQARMVEKLNTERAELGLEPAAI